MADCKTTLINDVTEALAFKLDQEDIEIVSDEMALALKDYEVTKLTTDMVVYEGLNEQILKKYKACLIIAGRSPKTIYGYERCMIRLFQVVQRNYTDMTVSDLRYFLAYEKSRGVSNRTLENTRVRIKSFFTWLMDEELIPKNPCRTLTPIKYEEKIRLPFSPVELDAMRSACRTAKERAIFELLLASGIRVSELCTIHLSDIDFNKMTVRIREGKGAKQRTVYINDLAKKHLVEYLTVRKIDGESLFYNKKGGALKAGGVRHLLKLLEARAGVTNVHPHRFRRTFATQLSNRGMPLQEIQKLLGHTNINTTMEYVVTTDDAVHVSYMKFTA